MPTLLEQFSSLKLIRSIARITIKTYGFMFNLLGLMKFKALIANCGNGSFYNLTAEIKYGENISIGNNVTVGPYCCFGAHSRINIGDNCRISRGVVIETAGLQYKESIPYLHISNPIVIKNGVWIATNAIILGGVTIGENSIIGAGAVITKDVKPNSVVVGNPSKEIKIIERA